MKNGFRVDESLHKLQHFLPTQAPLKDFIHHNTLHAFQDQKFFQGLQSCSDIFGYKTSLSLAEYRDYYAKGRISDDAIDYVIKTSDSIIPIDDRKQMMLLYTDNSEYTKRIGELRKYYKLAHKIDLSSTVHQNLFRIIGTYLDQGISAKKFPVNCCGILESIRILEANTYYSFFRSKRVRALLQKPDLSLTELLTIVVGNEAYFEQYLFDQQFEHPGWSGMISVVELRPQFLFEKKTVSLHDFICLELLLEIDALDKHFGIGKWKPIATVANVPPLDIFASSEFSAIWELKSWWQRSFEWTYYDQVLHGLVADTTSTEKTPSSFQAYFCIDDREESIRRHIELLDPECETYGTPAHFNLPIYYRPAGGKFNTQVCPGVIQPKHIILDDSNSEKHDRDLHFHQSSHSFFSGWLIAQTVGFWSALKLFLNVFKPTVSPGHSSSFDHMSHRSQLIIENTDANSEGDLQIGFTLEEMIEIVHSELMRTDFNTHSAPIVYLFGHGGSSTNNPYYAGYNCGACSGKPSSLNARVFANMANRSDVRAAMQERGLSIPETTQFIGGLHDTTRDEFAYYDLHTLSPENMVLHRKNVALFEKALANNAKERARQFISIDSTEPPEKLHLRIKKRSVALFEPRPELNHSNNCLCIVGNRQITRNLFLDQRAFLNSYNWKADRDGSYLTAILNAATPVCGGINLEYYFSRVDNENFGAGSKLPHNVVGLFGLANGVEGDLRTGLPSQMIEVHDPLRLMMVIQQKPEVIENVLAQNPGTKAWYDNGWLNLSVIDPETRELYVYRDRELISYKPDDRMLQVIKDLTPILESTHENLPVLRLN